MPSPMHWCLLSNRKSCQTGSLSSYDKPSVSGFIQPASTIPKRLETSRTTSTALRIFGIRQNASCENTTESIANLSRCSWKNANFGLTSAHRLNSLKSCGIGVEFRANLVQPLLKYIKLQYLLNLSAFNMRKNFFLDNLIGEFIAIPHCRKN